MKMLSLMALASILSLSSCAHKKCEQSKSCCSKESCSKEKKEKECKDGSCDKKEKQETTTPATKTQKKS